MFEEQDFPGDGAALATEVRGLAAQVNRVMNDPSTTAGEAVRVRGRVARLRDEVRRRGPNPLSRWLDSLALRVDTPRR